MMPICDIIMTTRNIVTTIYDHVMQTSDITATTSDIAMTTCNNLQRDGENLRYFVNRYGVEVGDWEDCLTNIKSTSSNTKTHNRQGAVRIPCPRSAWP